MFSNRPQKRPGRTVLNGRSAILLALLAVVMGFQGQALARTPTRNQQLPGSVRWGFYITYNPNSWVSLQANASRLNYVSPWFYNLGEGGQITGKDRPEVGALLKQVGAKNLPMLKNTPTYDDFTAILTDTNKQAFVISQIDSLITANGYDGITIDFEALNGSDNATLTAFMGRLYARLHARGKLVAMAVPAKVRDSTNGWSAAYDYPGLSPVLDYLLIMAYDFHWVNSDPGPIAPISKLRDTANYAITRVPAAKIIWGVGVYGYDWGNSPTGGGDGTPAEYPARRAGTTRIPSHRGCATCGVTRRGRSGMRTARASMPSSASSPTTAWRDSRYGG
jgi:spore germination protein